MILRIGDRQYVAGLYWRDRLSEMALLWRGLKGGDRRRGIRWYVHRDGQTGFAEGPRDGPQAPGGVPSLAAALSAHIVGSEAWMALVEGAGGRFALLKAGDGGMLADGESVYTDREEAVAAFEAARDVGWPLYATRGLVEGAVDLDVETLAPSTDMAMRRMPLAGWTARRAAASAAVASTAAAAAGAYSFSDEIWRWWSGPEETAEEETEAERTVSVAIDGWRLVEGCRAALAAQPPALPGWETVEVLCEASLSDPGLQAARPEMIDRPALVVRWRLEPRHAAAAAVWRRVAERHLADGWYAAGVNAEDAWATQPLPPVLGVVPEEWASRGFLAFRESVDAVFGAGGARLEYGISGSGGDRTVSIRTGLPAVRIAGFVRRIGDMEVVSLSRASAGGWVVEGRQAAPARLLESRFEALTGEKIDAG